MPSKLIAYAKQTRNLFTVTITLLLVSATAALAEAYKTSTNQVIVTGLQANKKYTIQTVSSSNRQGTRTITTNSCGEALISYGTNYQRFIINQQTIVPSSLQTRTHQRCKPRHQSSGTNN